MRTTTRSGMVMRLAIPDSRQHQTNWQSEVGIWQLHGPLFEERLVASLDGLGWHSDSPDYRSRSLSRTRGYSLFSLDVFLHLCLYRSFGLAVDVSALLQNHLLKFDRSLWYNRAKRNTTLIDHRSARPQEFGECAGMVTRSCANRLQTRWEHKLDAHLASGQVAIHARACGSWSGTGTPRWPRNSRISTF